MAFATVTLYITRIRSPIWRGPPSIPASILPKNWGSSDFSAAELARQIEVPVNCVTGIINGQRSVTADTALRLGHWFGTSPEFWLNLQKLYELRLACKEIGRRVNKLPRLRDQKKFKSQISASPKGRVKAGRDRDEAAVTPLPIDINRRA